MTISLIAAIGTNREIGYKNQLLWHLSADLKRFKAITMGHTVIMGQKTFDSIGKKPLSGRKNIVISDQEDYFAEGVIMASSIDEALTLAKDDGEVFIIGGASIYKQFLPVADKLYLTDIHKSYRADAFFPDFDLADWNTIEQSEPMHDEKTNVKYSFRTLSRNR
jgi:dihydrofolate reductase